LARAIKENNNVLGGYHSTLAEIEVAARDGCDVCALLATHLRRQPGARNFYCGLGTGDPAKGLVFWVDFNVEGEKDGIRLNFRLYEASEGVLYALSRSHVGFSTSSDYFYRAIIDPSSKGKRGAKYRVYIELGSG